jgi:hypothetical protein
MLVQCSKGTIFLVTEVALEAPAIPSCACCDVLCVEVGIRKQLVRQYTTGIALADSLKDCAVIDVLSPWA